MYITGDQADLSPEIVRVAFHFLFHLIHEYVSKFDVIISNDAITCGRTCMYRYTCDKRKSILHCDSLVRQTKASTKFFIFIF